MAGSGLFSKFECHHHDDHIIIVHRVEDAHRIEETVTKTYVKYRGVCCPFCDCDWLVLTKVEIRTMPDLQTAGFRCRKCGSKPVTGKAAAWLKALRDWESKRLPPQI